jgi:hypothetical protein
VLIGGFVEDLFPRRFFDFIVFAGSPLQDGSGGALEGDWGRVLPVELGVALVFVVLASVWGVK